jgi:hypothetical protein
MSGMRKIGALRLQIQPDVKKAHPWRERALSLSKLV